MDSYKKVNQSLWNDWTSIHEKSAFYNLEGFKSGKNRLSSIELKELGDVSGRSLLHLQCHFGLDTLSWARLGAKVTGVDFSVKAILLAQRLSQEVGLEAQFICSDIYNLPNVLIDEFDIVFISYGVLCWLPDLQRWAEIIAHFLKPGGTFYIVEFHPFACVFDDEDSVTDLRVRFPYFRTEKPLQIEMHGSYADPEVKYHSVYYEWRHSISDIINSLIYAKLKIEFLHEFPYCVENRFPWTEQGEDGLWKLKKYPDALPLLFSLKATK